MVINKNLNGVWWNELMSNMTITQDSNGMLTGHYHTAVGKATDYYLLTGRVNMLNNDFDGEAAVGLTVVWHNQYSDSHSVTTWSGQYKVVGAEQTEMIRATWLLTDETTPQDDWTSTRVGIDVFTREMPSKDDVQYSLSKGVQPSHPLKLMGMNEIDAHHQADEA